MFLNSLRLGWELYHSRSCEWHGTIETYSSREFNHKWKTNHLWMMHISAVLQWCASWTGAGLRITDKNGVTGEKRQGQSTFNQRVWKKWPSCTVSIAMTTVGLHSSGGWKEALGRPKGYFRITERSLNIWHI